MGRTRIDSENYLPRIIDIDILLFDDEIIFSPNLIVPHPKMLERKFVLVPLTEIAPNLRHPIEKLTILMCLQKSSDSNCAILEMEQKFRLFTKRQSFKRMLILYQQMDSANCKSIKNTDVRM